MSRDKQIEKMYKDVYDAINHNAVVDITHGGYIGVNTEGLTKELYDDGYRKAEDVAELEERLADVTANWQKIHDAYTADCIEHYNKGRSEGAREIFEEIEDAYYECIHINPTTNIGHLLQTKFLTKLAELKKKYTEGEG